ncbi:cell division site-positioning protein MapZ family protein [Streptococcus hillyeri]|uniref:cell division site-positioning protein MapZ family protein n=1 Tax=Streptococcus hillyeri TaxID=2282420 RepID=UPI0034E2D840
MSEKNTAGEPQGKLNFEQAKEMTIEEAVRKEAELKVGITENDSILDKYIKQNREEVNSQKFENTRDLSELRHQNVESLVAAQQENLEETKELDQKQVDEEITSKTEAIPVSVIDKTEEFGTSNALDGRIALGEEESAKPFYKKKGLWIGTVLTLILGGSAITYGMLQNNSSQSTKETVTQTESTTEAKQEVSKKEKQNLEAFNKKYAAFFVDEGQSKLKNSEFGKVSELENLLKALEGSSYYNDAKTKFERLNKSIKAVQSVNDKFESEAIVDGEKVVANLKSNASLDDLTAATLNTGNATLDTLLQAVVAEARSNTGVSGNTNGAASAPVTTPAQAAPASSIYGITNYDVNTLQRQLSRVPYNFDVIADTNNRAWTFNEGILEKIVATAQERGYITGNDYILEKVNIINGNGYYNMFKPDGTYLFSINCKTGYFVGNAKGHADNLDY